MRDQSSNPTQGNDQPSRHNTAPGAEHTNHQHDDHGYDDGLVHSHGWAVSSPER